MFFPSIWELIERFKAQCDGKGWKICGNEDLIKVGNEYHYFVWSLRTHPSTFRRVINLDRRIPIREDKPIKLVSLSYMVWISPSPISEEALEIFSETPDLSRKVAVYDMSLNL